MSGEISNYPRGLISLLGLKDAGQTPRNLSPTIAPTFDTNQWFLTNLRETIAAAVVNQTTVGTKLLAELIVPAGELWYVHQYCVNANPLPAASSLRVRPAYIEAAGYAPAIGPSGSAAVVGEALRLPAIVPLILTAGSQLGYFVEAITGNCDIGAGIVFSRLRA